MLKKTKKNKDNKDYKDNVIITKIVVDEGIEKEKEKDKQKEN